MKSVDIKILLMKKGITQSSIANKLGVTLPFINHVINGQRATKRVRKAIAKAVGKRIDELWPSGPINKAA